MRLLHLSAALLCAAVLFTADDKDQPPKLPAGADKAYKAYVAALQKASAAETAKVQKLLAAEQDKATKAGKLDDAMAIKGLLAEIDKGKGYDDAKAASQEDLIAEHEKSKADGVSDPKEAEKFAVGTWDAKCSNGWRGVMTLKLDKTDRVAMCSDGNIGSWSVSAKLLTVVWQNGVTERFPLPLRQTIQGNGNLGTLTWVKRD